MASPGTSSTVLPDRRPDPERTGSPAVLLAGVTRVFGITPALVRVDLRIERGETVLVRGPNGAGKSTLLRLVATAISPTYGSGSVLGFDLARQRREIRRRTELLGHRTRFYEDLTARENLRFTCALHGLDRTSVPAALERVGLADVADERVRTYSQGMRQRLALGRLTVRQPELLLFDEPYAGLDAQAKSLVDDLMAEAKARGQTVVLATHDETRGAQAGRSFFVEDGRVLEVTNPPAAVEP